MIRITPKAPSLGQTKSTISVRIPNDLFDRLNDLANASDRSRNYVINQLLEQIVDRVKIVEGFDE